MSCAYLERDLQPSVRPFRSQGGPERHDRSCPNLRGPPESGRTCRLAYARCDPKVPEADVTLERFAARRLRTVEKWQAEGYPCPPAGVTLDLEAATVSLGDALGDG